MEGGPRRYTPALLPHHHDHQHADIFINNDEPPKIPTSLEPPPQGQVHSQSIIINTLGRAILSTPFHVVMLNRSSQPAYRISPLRDNLILSVVLFSSRLSQKQNITAIDYICITISLLCYAASRPSSIHRVHYPAAT